MEEIRVGDYIRTKDGYIDKVVNVRDGFVETENLYSGDDNIFGGVYYPTLLKDIKSHKNDIIDLIEAGDIVCIKDSLYDNEYKSEVFEDYNNMLCINNFEEDEILELRKNIQDKQIELVSILTHEMYEQNCYKVGGENE